MTSTSQLEHGCISHIQSSSERGSNAPQDHAEREHAS